MQFRCAHLIGVLEAIGISPEHGITGTASRGDLEGPRSGGQQSGTCIFNYRLYQHGCGHQQRIARANLQTERFSCGCCGECWSAAPSWLYLLRLHLPGHGPVVKLGYSRNPQSRMRYQFGMTARLGCALVVSIPMATGHDALKLEKRLHGKLRRHYPEAVLPREAIARHLNLVSEIYDAALEPTIRTELERIARTPAS